MKKILVFYACVHFRTFTCTIPTYCQHIKQTFRLKYTQLPREETLGYPLKAEANGPETLAKKVFLSTFINK